MSFLQFLDGTNTLRNIDVSELTTGFFRLFIDSRKTTNVIVESSETITTPVTLPASIPFLAIGDKASVTYKITATGIVGNVEFGFFGSNNGNTTDNDFVNIIGNTTVTWNSDRTRYFHFNNTEELNLTHIRVSLLAVGGGGTPQLLIETSYNE